MKPNRFILAAALLGLAALPSLKAGVSVSIGIPIAPVVIHEAPPRPVVERVVASPGPGYVWVAGHHEWHHHRWVWVSGYWVLPPRPGLVWVDGRYDGHSHNYYAGYWAEVPMSPPPAQASVVVNTAPVVPDAPVVGEVYVESAPPPPPPPAVIVARPSPAHIWIDGYYVWQGGHHLWIAGHWEMPPSGCHEWVAARWEPRGHNYVFIAGRWR